MNAKKKIAIIMGTRPEAIKLAPVILEAKKRNKFDVTVVVTAQHRDLLDDVLQVFNISPDYDLNIMVSGQTLSDVTARVVVGVEKILSEEKQDIIIVQGDTTTVFASALAAYYQKIPVAHVEAGLRTYDKFQPFPEEINRRLVSHIGDYHYCPTELSRKNLLNEGINSNSIVVTGNTVIDALLSVLNNSRPLSPKLSSLDFSKKIILLTAHRRENFGEPIRNILFAVKELSSRHPDILFVYPVHPNPNVQKPVREILGGISGVVCLPPLDYVSLCQLMERSFLVLTDSGGIQEEAPSLNKPVLILRNVTERPEVVESGAAKLVGTDYNNIIDEVESLLTDPKKYQTMAEASNPFGDGKAATKILDHLESKL